MALPASTNGPNGYTDSTVVAGDGRSAVAAGRVPLQVDIARGVVAVTDVGALGAVAVVDPLGVAEVCGLRLQVRRRMRNGYQGRVGTTYVYQVRAANLNGNGQLLNKATITP